MLTRSGIVKGMHKRFPRKAKKWAKKSSTSVSNIVLIEVKGKRITYYGTYRKFYVGPFGK